MSQTVWRGVRLDARSAAMMDEVCRLLPLVSVRPTQGSWSTSVGASGGTHAGCGALDLHARTLPDSDVAELVHALRLVGFAAWDRTSSQGPWPRHVHAVAMQPGRGRGCLSYSAFQQTRSYVIGRNGLANNAPDDGPRGPWVGRTWEQYQAAAVQPPDDEREDEDMLMVEADGRGVMLCSAGWTRILRPEERDVFLSLGVRLSRTNARGFDVAKHAVLHGVMQAPQDD